MYSFYLGVRGICQVDFDHVHIVRTFCYSLLMESAVSGYLDRNDLWDNIADNDLDVYYL